MENLKKCFNENPKLENVILNAKKFLKNYDIPNVDANVIIMNVLNLTKVELYTKNDIIIGKNNLKTICDCLKKRISGMPTQYIISKCEFMGLDFFVDENVLIPRCDTEIVVEKVLEYNNIYKFNNFLEIGTGSGCIPISIINYSKNLFATTVDISEKATLVAKKNADKNNVLDKIEFINGNLFDNLNDEHFFNSFDFLVSNPPYIEKEEIKNLMVEVKDFEPVLALDGGEDGLYFYEAIVKNAHKYLKPFGYIFFEIGFNQANAVTNILKNNQFNEIKVFKDLYNNDRVVVAKAMN